MYRRRITRKTTGRPRRTIRPALRQNRAIPRAPRYPRRTITTNTASVKECLSTAIPDGIVTYFRNTQLADPSFDRAQTVAQAYQQFRIKYIKFTFRPSADTFTPVAGNVIPQLYFMMDKSNAIPTNANAATFFSMGARPRRMDDKNLVYAWKPTVLNTSLGQAGVMTSADLLTTPWLSTNANAQNPGAAWAPSTIAHLGCVFYVTKINPNDNIQYSLDVEVVFQFRKPLWKASDSQEPQQSLIYLDGKFVTSSSSNAATQT